MKIAIGDYLSLTLMPLLSLCGCQAVPSTDVAISKADHTIEWWGNPKGLYGPRKHYLHRISDAHGELMESYSYYYNANGRPVLDGLRTIYRNQPYPGVWFNYRDGRLVSKGKIIVTG